MTPPIRMVSVPVEVTEDRRNRLKNLVEALTLFSKYGGVLVTQSDALVLSEDLSALLTAAPVREEVGAGDYTMALAERQPFEAHPALAAHIERMAGVQSVGSLIEWDAFLRELNAALATREEAPDWTARTEAAWAENNSEEAPAEAGEPEALRMAYKTGYQEGVEDSDGNFCRDACEEGWGQYLEALRAQPQAREEVQPMAWNGRGKCDCSDDTGLCPRCFPDLPSVATPPAPEAEKLRENGK